MHMRKRKISPDEVPKIALSFTFEERDYIVAIQAVSIVDERGKFGVDDFEYEGIFPDGHDQRTTDPEFRKRIIDFLEADDDLQVAISEKFSDALFGFNRY